MRKLFIAGSALFFNSFLFSQVTLNKTVLTTNVNQIEAHSGGGVRYSTSSGFYMYECGDNTTEMISTANINAILYGEAYGNDTLSVSEALANFYFGINNSITDGTNTHNMYTFVNAITTDGDSVYTIGKYGAMDFNIVQIQGSGTNYFGSNFSASGLEDYSDLEYFELSGERYIAIISQSYGLSVYNINNGEHYLTDEYSATSVAIDHNGLAYFSKGDEIYQITSIDPHANPIYKTIVSTHEYSIDVGQTINEFSFNIYDGELFVAASDGVYAECLSTVSVNEIESNEIILYPNPSNGQFNIKGIEVGSNISIINSQGQLIYEQKELNQTSLNMDIELSNGLYFVKIQSNGAVQTVRMVINN